MSIIFSASGLNFFIPLILEIKLTAFENCEDFFDLIFIDGLHHYEQVKKDINNSLKFLKKGGVCIIDDTSWLPYIKNEYRDNSSNEYTNRKTFEKIIKI